MLTAIATALIANSGCDRQAAAPPVTTVTTVSSLADASRRLELNGYRYGDQTSVLGQRFASFKKETPEAAYSVEIIRWADDQRLKSLHFRCTTNFDTFSSDDARKELWAAVHHDVCSLIACKDDYYRALDDMTKVKDEGLGRFEGQATTADGWRVLVIEYIGYRQMDISQKENKVIVATVDLTHIKTSEEMTGAAIVEFDQVLNSGKEK